MNADEKERNDVIFKERMNKYNALPGCRVGDWIRELNGRMTRATHDWNEAGQDTETIQHGGSEHGQYYLGEGYLSYSGGLDTGIKKNQLVQTDEKKPGKVWFFKNDYHTAHNGIDYMADFRVFEVKGVRDCKKGFYPSDLCRYCEHLECFAHPNKPQPEQVQTYNGNGQPMIRPLPKVVINTKNNLDPIVLNHIKENTDMVFIRGAWGYEAQPMTSNQLVRLFMTYNIKTRTEDNNTHKNTMFLTFAEAI